MKPCLFSHYNKLPWAELCWFWALPPRYKLVVQAWEVREHLELTRGRYEQISMINPQTHAQKRARWIDEALRKVNVSYEDFRRGDLLDDERAEHLAGLYNLPVFNERCYK